MLKIWVYCTLLNFECDKFSGWNLTFHFPAPFFVNGFCLVRFSLTEHIHFVWRSPACCRVKNGWGAAFVSLWRKQMIYLNETTCSFDCIIYAFLSLAMAFVECVFNFHISNVVRRLQTDVERNFKCNAKKELAHEALRLTHTPRENALVELSDDAFQTAKIIKSS